MTNPTGAGKYSKIIRGLHEAIATIEKVTSRALEEKDAEIQRLRSELASLNRDDIEAPHPAGRGQ